MTRYVLQECIFVIWCNNQLVNYMKIFAPYASNHVNLCTFVLTSCRHKKNIYWFLDALFFDTCRVQLYVHNSWNRDTLSMNKHYYFLFVTQITRVEYFACNLKWYKTSLYICISSLLFTLDLPFRGQQFLYKEIVKCGS